MDRKLGGLILLALAGCSTSGSSILVGEGGPYPATSPEQVTLLAAPPSRAHVSIALVEGVAATDDYFTRPRTEAAAVEALRKEAARIGANAVVLTGKASAPYGQVGYTSGTLTGGLPSAFYSATTMVGGWEKITVSGTAIRYTQAP